jgi:phosphoribosylformylglycinamidine synthase subunit PurL
VFGETGGLPAPLDLAAEAALVAALWRWAPLLSVAHDASEGGLAVALAEAALASGIGAELDLPEDAWELFGEGGGRVVVACPREHVDRLRESGVPLRELGVAGGETLAGIPLTELADAWGDA